MTSRAWSRVSVVLAILAVGLGVTSITLHATSSAATRFDDRWWAICSPVPSWANGPSCQVQVRSHGLRYCATAPAARDGSTLFAPYHGHKQAEWGRFRLC